MFEIGTPRLPDELLVAFVGSPRADARIIAVDANEAREIEGIAGVFVATDIPGENHLGPASLDAELLAGSECRYSGQPIIALAGESVDALRTAMSAVYLELDPPAIVLTHDEAVAMPDLSGATRRIVRGDLAAALPRSRHVLEGTIRADGPIQLDLETPSALAFLAKDGQIIIHATTGCPSRIRSAAARCLGLPEDQVICHGACTTARSAGPESPVARAALLAALVAFKTSRPARFVDPSNLDPRLPPKGDAHFATYRVGFAANGRIDGLAIDHYFDNARAEQIHDDVVLHALLNADSAYFVPNFAVTWTIFRSGLLTNFVSRTVGVPQAVAVIENVMEEIARHLGLDTLEVRRQNCYATPGRDTTHFGQIVTNNTLPALVDRLAGATGYTYRRDQALRFNDHSRTHLRGLALTPVKYGFASAPQPRCEHLPAPVDELLLSPAHLCLPDANVFNVRGPDQRLSWSELVRRAHEANVELSARGFYPAPLLDLHRDTSSGNPLLDYAIGAAVTEVEIERMTGKLTVMRVDILIDIGDPSGPGVERAHVFSQFIQGLRWSITDERPDSRRSEFVSDATNITGAPNFADLSRVVNIDFLGPTDGQTSDRADKSMGALPFLLGVSAWAAVKQALASIAGRRSASLNLPAAPDEILRCLAGVNPADLPAHDENTLLD